MGRLEAPERPATETDHEAAAEALALAFADDPCWAHLLPNDSTRAERLLAYFTTEIEILAPDYREVWITEESLPAHLEASTDRNRALNERNGFALTEVFNMPASGPSDREM